MHLVQRPLHSAKCIKQQNKKVSRTRFYYVVSSLDKPVPAIHSDQAFYQDLWDNRRTSKHCLKRTVKPNSKSDESPQPSKKQACRVEPTVKPNWKINENPQPSKKQAHGAEPTSLDSGMLSTVQSSPLDQDETNLHLTCWLLRGNISIQL